MTVFTTKDPLTIDDVVTLSLNACGYGLVNRAIEAGELPAEKVDGRHVVTRSAAEAWIASRRGRTLTVPGLTIEAVAALSGGKETAFSVRRAIELGDLAATPVPEEVTSSVRAAIDANELPEVVSVASRFSIDPNDAATWLARTAPTGIDVDAVVRLGAGRVNPATVARAILTGALPAERFADRYVIQSADAATWLAALPAVNL